MATQGLFDLFGPSAQDIRTKYEESLFTPISQVALRDRPAAMGSGLGRVLAYKLGRAMGGKLPGEAEAEALQQVLSQAQKAGLSGSALYKRLAETTADPRRALQFAQLAQQAEAAESEAAQEAKTRELQQRKAGLEIARLEGEPARKAAEQQAKLTTISSLVPNINPKLAAGLASPEGEKAYTEFLSSQIKTKAPDTEIAKLLASRDALPLGHPNRKVYDARILKLTDTNNPNSAIEKMADALVKATVGAVGKEVGTSVAQLPTQEEAAGYIDRALTLLDKGIYTGFYGKAQETATAATGGAIGSEKRLTNTQIFRNYIGQVVIPRLKEFGGNDSVEELRFLERVEGGDTSITEEALKATLESAKQKIQRGIRLKRMQEKALSEGKTPPMSLPKEQSKQVPKKRYNPETGKVEVVKD